MREIPMRYVIANQTGIALSVILTFLIHQPLILVALWAVQLIGLLTEGRYNLFVILAKLVIRNKGQETQAVELQRFNNVLALLFLSLALISFACGWQIVGYAFSALLLLAASAALLGFCIGCTVYFWIKQIRAGRRIRRS